MSKALTSLSRPVSNPDAGDSAATTMSDAEPPARRRAPLVVWALCRREIGAALGSPATLVLLGGAALFMGFVFVADFVDSRNSDPRNLFSNFGMVMLLVGPALTMRSFSDEKQRNTMEHLLSAPARDGELVAGKFLGSFAMGALLLLATTLVPVTMVGAHADLDQGTLLARYLGSLCLVAAVVAVGVAASSLAANHFVAALASLLLLLALQYAGLADLNRDAWLATVVSDAGLTTHQDAYLAGSLAVRDLVYFASLTAGGLGASWWGVRAARQGGWGQ